MLSKKFFHLLSLVILALITHTAVAQDLASEKLTVFVKTVVTFKADFEQTITDQKGRVLEQAQGQFMLERPGRFRWDYQQPYPQHIIADGEHIWFYDVDLEQVTVKSQKEALTSTPASLLSGELLPEEKYHVNDLPAKDGLVWVELIPKESESNFQTVILAFEGNNLKQMLMKDSFEQQTKLVFRRAAENIAFSDDEFNFTPPEGVDVVGDTAL